MYVEGRKSTVQGHTGEAVQPAAGLGVTNQQQATQPYLRLFPTAHRLIISGWQHETQLARINSQQPAASSEQSAVSSEHLATGAGCYRSDFDHGRKRQTLLSGQRCIRIGQDTGTLAALRKYITKGQEDVRFYEREVNM
ncbi:predicted protein [Histoplasma capsulatum G186AR]|uniref:Uncharacterized protein n=1 Tax=Ajellomyces capsulatus (strain G186AR / H82 / ATCC MYA-2454 / RMSCC 2432) TaxID=447093 RepID=C0NY17_AJECG|nr:uncharacterized protein HCBG_07811 [Histoplasma capsulatum G186AR]EEH03685.1 predicted protein [Histoplasma capsulatum G186AR]